MDTNLGGILGVSGYGQVAVICVLIVLEELGVPMPFAPGDLLLVLVGVSIATTHVNPFIVLLATYASALAGATAGREIFARLGVAALQRIGSVLKARDRIDALSGRLRRGGAAAVFVGRITPGLRVVTTEVSGLVAVPRRTFLKGLVPGVAVYQAVFVGLGAWLGPAAWATIERHSPKPGQLVILVLVAVAAALAWRAIMNNRPTSSGARG